ncbi:uncharacterized protein LOC132626567 [Lycium barbarum]|uniref:uncharacterized protein LOC132626567 n=1 Tax=Lycium barbarum TaxID=112863 RepID=UPI00293F5BE4|nr:uncharacterized protein LOC132626567 [Lycium barbarum]
MSSPTSIPGFAFWHDNLDGRRFMQPIAAIPWPDLLRLCLYTDLSLYSIVFTTLMLSLVLNVLKCLMSATSQSTCFNWLYLTSHEMATSLRRRIFLLTNLSSFARCFYLWILIEDVALKRYEVFGRLGKVRK